MASTSAPRARSSASKVDVASPSPANASSARHSAAATSPVGPSLSPASGGAATRAATQVPGCWPRVAWT
eukprot:2387412-Pleurochrysis_carterae.AAC.1